MSTEAPRPRPLYDAFISYSWAKDKPLVARLRKVLQTLGKPWWQRRSLRIFVDETSLSATPQLWPSIERAMAQSRYMILFASPEAARSRWVDMEVGAWLRTKPANTVLIALSGGELLWDQATSDFRHDENTPLPQSLRGAFETEPKWVDLRAFREAGNVKSDDRFLAAGADFAAIIAGIPKEDLLSEEVRQQRRAVRLAYGAATMLGLLALVAAGLGLVAKQQSDIATENYLTARGTVDRIISSFAGRLSQMQGLTIDTVETAFKEISRSVDELGMRAAASDPTFDKTRADLAYEFARTYKKVESPRAPLLVEESLRLLEGLAARDPKNRDYTLAISNSHELMSDLMRTSSAKQAWQANEKALALRRQLNKEQPNSSTWAESLSKSLIRAGDLEAQANRDFAAASKRYYEALDLSLSWWLQTEDDSSWQRELSWALSKIGDQKSRGSASSQSEALAHFEQELCLRRGFYELDRSNTLYQSDVSWSLERVGRARQRLGDLSGADKAFMESIVLRRALLERDRNNEIWLRDLYVIVTRYGLLQLDSGAARFALVYLSEAQHLHAALTDRKALQTWLPDFAAALAKARADLGDDAERLLSAFEADAKQKESMRTRVLLAERPTSAECWPRLTSELAALAVLRGIAPAGNP